MECYCGQAAMVTVFIPEGKGWRQVRRCYEHGKNMVRDIPGAKLSDAAVIVVKERRT